MSHTSEPITITLTRYREPDWLVREALESLARQEGVAGEVIFLDQNWREDFAREVTDYSNKRLSFRCLPCEEKGLSYARNRGLALAANKFVLQVDPDVVAESDWAKNLVGAFKSEEATIAGSRILPRWRERPPILAKSRIVLDQYSILDWGADTRPVHRIVGAGYGVNKRAPGGKTQFRENMGRRDGILFSGAESNFCRRTIEAGGKVVYVGEAVLHHQILPERLRWSWVLRRLYFAGASRRQQGGMSAPSQRLGVWDWLLSPIILPPYALGYIAARQARPDMS